MLRKSLLPAFSNIAAGETSTCDLPLGRKIHAIHLELGDDGTASTNNGAAVNTTLDNLITQIRLKVNDKAQWTLSASQMNSLNSLMNPPGGTKYSCKTSGTAGQAAYRLYLPLFFAEPWRTNPAEIPALAMNLNQINSFRIEVDLNGGEANHAPVLRGFYEWEPADTGRGIGVIKKFITANLQAVGASNTFQLNRKDLLSQFSLFATTDGKYVDHVKLNANGEDIQDIITYLENQAILLSRDMSPDTANTPRFDVILDYDDPITNALPAGSLSNLTLDVYYNAAAAGGMTMISQTIGAPD